VTDNYRRALDAEPRLQPIERIVDVLCSIVRPNDQMCAGCVWELIVKPLTSNLVGWGRGYPTKQAKDPTPDAPPFEVLAASDILKRTKSRPTPESETEAWMRTTEAWDAVTNTWLTKLDKADPANGHGIGRTSVHAR
jgi:hypothetical protein